MRPDAALKPKLDVWDNPRNWWILFGAVAVASIIFGFWVGYGIGRQQLSGMFVQFPPGTVIRIPAAPASN